MRDRDLVGLRIRNTENVQDMVMGIRFRRRDQLNSDVVWNALGKVVQYNAVFGLSDRLEVHFDLVRMSAGNGTMAGKTKGWYLDVLSAIKNLHSFCKGRLFVFGSCINYRHGQSKWGSQVEII